MLIKHELLLRDELAKPAYAADIAAGAWQKIADTLNARASIPNPTPRGTVPLRFTWDTFIGLLAPAEVLGMYNYGDFAADLRRALERSDRVEMLALWRAAKTVLAGATVTKVETEFGKSQPDPDWQATVLQPSIAMGLGIPAPSPDDVQFVVFRHRGA